ncbi:hypothetical protein ABEB36_011212 [Hypothenemus hampei]|uniref:F-box domain-containing protein n=1 Tax=Hypothenemus hampei TaxID=57062 RepID=A0ABD1EF84_HYPHA
MTNFKMHRSWEKANVVVRILSTWIDYTELVINGKWQLVYETCHSRDPSENYKECSEVINTIRIEFNRNFLMYNQVGRTLQTIPVTEPLPEFPLVFPLNGRVLYDGVQRLICNVVSEREPEAEWNGKNVTEALPTEVLNNIFGRLDLRSLSRCAQVNKRWNSIASDPHFYREVDLKGYWDKISFNTLEKLKGKLQMVRKLDMTWCNDIILIAPYEYFDSLTSILEGAQNTLTHLCLNHTIWITKPMMQRIFDCPNLEELRLRNIDLRYIDGWSESCKGLMKLKTLDVSLSMIEERRLIEMLKNTPNLEHLLIDDCDWLGNVDPIITTVVEYNPNLKSWSSSFTFRHKDNARGYEDFGKLLHLEYLDLSSSEPRPYGSSWLEHIAMNCQKLKRLDLGFWKELTDEDLLPIVTQCKELSYLYLPSTPKISFSVLSTACKNLPNLRHICIFWCYKITVSMVKHLTDMYSEVSMYQIKNWHWCRY